MTIDKSAAPTPRVAPGHRTTDLDQTVAAKPATRPDPTSTAPVSRERRAIGQPVSGLIGLAIVAGVAALLGLAPGAQRALESIGPVSTFCLPVLAVAALWWNGWPLRTPSRALAGSVVTLLIIGAGIVLTGIGQAVVGDAQFNHLFGTADEAAQGHLVTFPWTVPLAAFVFATTLQLTFVCRKWPFASLPAVPAGLAALAVSWGIGISGYALLVNWDFVPAPARAAIGLRNPGGPVNALDLIGMLLCVVVWQMTIFFLLEGYPVSTIKNTAVYLVVANATTVGLGLLTWVVLHDGMNRSVPQISAFAGVMVAGTLIVGLLFEGWPVRVIANAGVRRAATVTLAVVVAAVLGFALRALSVAAETWTREPAQLWVAVCGLNFIGAVVILHSVVWRRWPIPVKET